MKKLFTLIFCSVFFCANAQDSLKLLNNYRLQIEKTGMEVIGSWAVANLAVSIPAYYQTSGQAKYFYQMNNIWGLINLGLAVPVYIGTAKEQIESPSAEESLKQQKKIQNIFFVNAGLDIVYVGTGAYLNHRGIIKNSNELRGYGTSIILQGAFLFLFDGTMYAAEKRNGNKLRHFLAKNPVTFDGKKMGIIFLFRPLKRQGPFAKK